jgi:hypothetical protein
MEIHCASSSSFPVNNDGKLTQVVLCSEVRHDLALEQITRVRGVDFVLGAIGEEAIQRYMEANGYVVVDIEKTVKAA